MSAASPYRAGSVYHRVEPNVEASSLLFCSRTSKRLFPSFCCPISALRRRSSSSSCCALSHASSRSTGWSAVPAETNPEDMTMAGKIGQSRLSSRRDSGISGCGGWNYPDAKNQSNHCKGSGVLTRQNRTNRGEDRKLESWRGKEVESGRSRQNAFSRDSTFALTLGRESDGSTLLNNDSFFVSMDFSWNSPRQLPRMNVSSPQPHRGASRSDDIIAAWTCPLYVAMLHIRTSPPPICSSYLSHSQNV